MKNNASEVEGNLVPDEKTDVIKIDIDAVLRSRLPRHYRFIPKCLIHWLQRTICQDHLNRLLEVNAGKTGAEFCRGVLDHLNITYDVVGEDNLPPATSRRVVVMSNHPLGGLDGIAMIDYFSRRYGDGVKFVVNDLLMAVTPLQPVFLPVNKHGKQSRRALQLTNDAFSADDPIIVFPAGLVSRLHPSGEIKDLKWQKSFLQRSIDYARDIIPVHFDGVNSPFFYKFAKLRQRLGLKFNIEMIFLPREIFRNENAHFTISIGSTIPYTSLRGGKFARQQADEIMQIVYNLKKKQVD